jgi:murein DD-endopeptidase MepM/ murein hydrolase activator NlpD
MKYGGAMKYVFYFAGLLFSANALSLELYRYQDSSGQWVFGDKNFIMDRTKNVPDNTETITIADDRKLHAKPSIQFIEKSDVLNGGFWILKNPLPVMVQHLLGIKGQKGFLKSVLASPYEEIKLRTEDFTDSFSKKINSNTHLKLDHYYFLGKPIKEPKQSRIPLPYSKNKRFRISQGFNGKYSHSGRGSRYAVDIAMPVGELIRAVKPGLVADGRDDFSIGGAANYFFDKANHVTVMHDDGSYGIYAHILYGSMAVEVGDRVTTGQVLARIGSTGYSTGPHLHFVLRYNSGRGAYSIPFKFQTKQGNRVPKQGGFYSGTL